MSLNLSKTKELIVSLSRLSTATFPLVVIDDISIERVVSAKILGVVIDEHLTFDKHVHAVCTCCRSLMFLLLRLKQSCAMSSAALFSIAQSLIFFSALLHVPGVMLC